MQREARFILPKFDNEGHSIEITHNWCRNRLAEMFGGWTETEVDGGWHDAARGLIRDRSIAYDVAFEVNSENMAKFGQLLVMLAIAADQSCIYARLPDGEVVFVEQPAVAAAE